MMMIMITEDEGITWRRKNKKTEIFPSHTLGPLVAAPGGSSLVINELANWILKAHL